MDEEMYQRIKRDLNNQEKIYHRCKHHSKNVGRKSGLVDYIFFALILASFVAIFLVPLEMIVLPLGIGFTLFLGLCEHNIQKEYGVFQGDRKVISHYSKEDVFYTMAIGIIATLGALKIIHG